VRKGEERGRPLCVSWVRPVCVCVCVCIECVECKREEAKKKERKWHRLF
jgi:hypothetical protein